MTRIKSIDFLRFIFALIIVHFHIYSNLPKFYLENRYISTLCNNCNSARMVVELFFIISGYFLFKTFAKHSNESIFQFALNKLSRLWPVLLFSVICSAILGIIGIVKFNFHYYFMQLLMEQSNGISLHNKGINWYVSSYFWSIVFYFSLLKIIPQKYVNFIISIVTYFSYVILVHNISLDGFGREVIYSFISLEILRGIAGVGLGYLLGVLINNLQKIKLKFKTNKYLNFIIISSAEIFCFIFLIDNFIFHKMKYKEPMILILTFCILFILLVFNKGLLSKILNHNFSTILGRYAYSIYVMQQVIFKVLKETLWNQRYFVEHHFVLTLIFSVTISTIVGILVYHLIEKPCAKFLNNNVQFN